MSRKLNTTINSIVAIEASCLFSGDPYAFVRVETVDGQRFDTEENCSDAQAARLAKRAQGYRGRDIADLIAGQPSLKLVEVDPCYGSMAWGSENEMSLAAMEG